MTPKIGAEKLDDMIQIRIDSKLLGQIDGARGRLSRAEFMRRAIRFAVKPANASFSGPRKPVAARQALPAPPGRCGACGGLTTRVGAGKRACRCGWSGPV